MVDASEPQLDRTKIRAGLAIISLVVVAALVGVVLIDATPGRALMFAIAATAFVRAFLLARSLRSGR
ncbi:MAG TPA: hypothetical protein VGE43_14415 [Acidimicrobiales bacterium]